jgi:putative endonuclease
MLECKDGSFYIGYTTDVERRVKIHNEGKGAKYTRGRVPAKLVYTETFEDKTSALKREYEMKKLPRLKKEALLKQNTSYKEES